MNPPDKSVIVVDYLKHDEDWRLEEVTGKTASFRKLRAPDQVNNWFGQVINRPGSVSSDPVPNLAKFREQIGHKLRHSVQRRGERISK